MKHKILTIIFGMILLVGIIASAGVVYADDINYIGEIKNPSGINISDFTAGTTTTANFNFDYDDNINAAEHFPLIYKIDFNSSEEIPEVWKNDFEIKGGIVKRSILGIGFNEITLECSDEFPLIINHQIGSETIETGENGTFYCYNTTQGTIEDLKKHNRVSLDITSHPALYPGIYNLTAEMFYLNDSYAPKLSIINESYFDQYFKAGSYVDFEVEIKESNLKEYQARIIIEEEQDISFTGESVLDKKDIYHFFQTLPNDMPQGDFAVEILAEDFNGNRNETETIIKIDNTAPEISLIQPTEDEVYSGMMSIEFNVTDEKAGVKDVTYRLKEMDENNNICPIGIGSWSCYDSGWVTLNYDTTTRTFKDEIDTTGIGLNGRYWLQAKACDKLGNCREFDPADKE